MKNWKNLRSVHCTAPHSFKIFDGYLVMFSMDVDTRFIILTSLSKLQESNYGYILHFAIIGKYT